MPRVFFLHFCFVLFASALSAAAALEIVWTPIRPGAAEVVVEATGLDQEQLAAAEREKWDGAKWQKVFAIYAPPAKKGQENPPAMLGVWKPDPFWGKIRFTPQFPLMHGVRYRAVLDPGKLPGAAAAEPVTKGYTLPMRAGAAATEIAAVYPSAPEVPENLLKFYIHFSSPMSGGRVYDHIRLLNDAGQPVELPFLEVDEELWDPDMKRLTLFIDPGRIKREVKPLEEIGPALVQGKRFTLVVDQEWKDAAGLPLAGRYRRNFTAGPPDRTPIDPAKWKITAPAAGSPLALSVAFDEPMDHALALRMLQVIKADGAAVAGTAKLGAGERAWSFVPQTPWAAGDYQIVVPVTIEDLAGNNIGKAFEVDIPETGTEKLTTQSVRLPFTVK